MARPAEASDKVGLIIFPIGRSTVSEKNCRRTLINTFDLEGFLQDVGTLPRETLDVIERALRGVRFVVWGTRESAFRNNPRALELLDLLVEESRRGSFSMEWIAAFYQSGRIVCPGRVLAAVKSPELSRVLWGSSEWLYVVFIEPCSGSCSEYLDPDTCMPRGTDAAVDAKLVFQDILGMNIKFARHTIVREVEGDAVGKLLELLRCAGTGDGEATRSEEKSVCAFLERVWGTERFRELTRLVEDVLRLQGALLIYGPPGVGKTSLAKCIAERLNADLITVTGHMWLSRHTLLGGYILHGAEARWEPGVIVKAARKAESTGRKVVVLLDEINRAEPERVLGELFTALADPDRVLVLPDAPKDLSTLSLKNVLFIATANSVDSVALARMGVAFHRRFPSIRLVIGGDTASLDDIKSNLGSILEDVASNELAGQGRGASDVESLSKRIADASLAVWEKILRDVVSSRGAEIAPGWSYAIDFARFLARLLSYHGDLDSENARRVCRRALETLYLDYLHLIGLLNVETSGMPGAYSDNTRELVDLCAERLTLP